MPFTPLKFWHDLDDDPGKCRITAAARNVEGNAGSYERLVRNGSSFSIDRVVKERKHEK